MGLQLIARQGQDARLLALAHAVAHLYQTVACWDPKLERFVVVISHSPVHRPGDLLE